MKAFAKLNLGLEVRGMRRDGYHEIRTLFQTIELHDELRIEEALDLALEVEGDAPAGPENLVWRAASALAQGAGLKPRARLRLVKRVPAGAGLGGGSADAAAALVGLDRLWRTRAGLDELYRIAVDLGADVPFFLLGGTALGCGRGEELFPLADLPEFAAVVVANPQPLLTAEVYRRTDKYLTGDSRSANNWGLPRLWCWDLEALAGLGNDLERGAFEVLPELGETKSKLAELGAVVALLTGSGSAVFGIFSERGGAEAAVRALRGQGLRAQLTRSVGRTEYTKRLIVEEGS